MSCTDTIKKETCYVSFLGIISVSIIVIISLILASCSFSNSGSCPSFHKHSGVILSSQVASHFNYGYGDVRYYIVNTVVVDNDFSCTMVSDSNYESYSSALTYANDLLRNSSMSVYTDGSNTGCLDEIPKEDNTGLIVILVLLFLSFFGFMMWIYVKVKKIITIYRFVNSDQLNYNLIAGLDDDTEIVFANEQTRQPKRVSTSNKQTKIGKGLLDLQENNDSVLRSTTV